MKFHVMLKDQVVHIEADSVRIPNTTYIPGTDLGVATVVDQTSNDVHFLKEGNVVAVFTDVIGWWQEGVKVP